MDIVSFETARRLKEAGFPQPRPAEGQIWYSQYGAKAVCVQDIGKTIIPRRGLPIHAWVFCDLYLTSIYNIDEACVGNWYFAPTATDILRELGYHYSLTFDDVRKVWEAANGANNDLSWSHKTNPAEACAAAWLACNKA